MEIFSTKIFNKENKIIKKMEKLFPHSPNRASGYEELHQKEFFLWGPFGNFGGILGGPEILILHGKLPVTSEN
jgi:hypothetical protein